MPIIKKVEFINHKIFATIILDTITKILVVYKKTFNINNIKIIVYLFWAAQIKLLKAYQAFLTISAKYLNYINIFSPALIVKLSEYIGINNHVIELKND